VPDADGQRQLILIACQGELTPAATSSACRSLGRGALAQPRTVGVQQARNPPIHQHFAGGL